MATALAGCASLFDALFAGEHRRARSIGFPLSILLVAAWFPADAQSTGTLSGVVVAERENPAGGRSLLFGSGEAPGILADTVRITLPRQPQFPKASLLPPNWNCSLDGRTWVCQGPPAPTPVRIRFDYPEGSAKKLDYEVLSSDQRIATGRDVPVQQLPPFEVQTTLDGIFQLPPEIYGGQRLDLQLLDPAKLPLDAAQAGFEGVWTVGGSVPYLEIDEVQGKPVLRMIVPGLAPGGPLSIRYQDLWGFTRLDVPDACGPNVKVVEPPEAHSIERHATSDKNLFPPRITDATPRVFAGERACVRGLFPAHSFDGLRFNGQPIGPPVTASDTTIWIRIPLATPPGTIEITGDPAAGFKPGEAVETVVIKVSGSIDRSKLLRGESTTLRLWIEGTAEPIALALKNHTPGIIGLDGGDEQIVTTSGGSPNAVERQVHAVSRGDFKLTYTLDGAQCPPANLEDILSELEPPARIAQNPPGGAPPAPANPPPLSLKDLLDLSYLTGPPAEIAPAPPGGALPTTLYPSLPLPLAPPDKKKELARCGPDLTAAFAESLQRIHERTKPLGIYERGELGSHQFASRQADVVADMPISASCPSLDSPPCLRTVTVSNRCYPIDEIFSLLKYVAHRLLLGNLPAGFGQGLSHELKIGVGYRRSAAAGDGSSRFAFTANRVAEQLESGDPFNLNNMEDRYSDEVTGVETELRPAGQCSPCLEPGTFSPGSDFSKADWKLANNRLSTWKP